MNITISGVEGMKDAVIASGIKTFIENLGLGIAIEVGTVAAAAPPAVIDLPVAAKRVYAKRVAQPKPIEKAVKKVPKTAQKRPVAAPAAVGGADARGTRRDAVRAALSATTPKNYYQLEQELKPVWPELDRSMISTIVCQLAAGGECVQEDGKWRLCK